VKSNDQKKNFFTGNFIFLVICMQTFSGQGNFPPWTREFELDYLPNILRQIKRYEDSTTDHDREYFNSLRNEKLPPRFLFVCFFVFSHYLVTTLAGNRGSLFGLRPTPQKSGSLDFNQLSCLMSPKKKTIFTFQTKSNHIYFLALAICLEIMMTIMMNNEF